MKSVSFSLPLSTVISLCLGGMLISSCSSQLGNSTHKESAQEQLESSTHVDNTFLIHLDPEACQVDIADKLGVNSVYEEEINEKKALRNIRINNIASHVVGAFPNKGNPNSIRARKASYSIPLNPSFAKEATHAQGYDSGVLFSGVGIDPFTAEFFIGTEGHANMEWNITTLTTTEDLGLDCNNAHVQPSGKYHYHGTPSAYLADLGVDGSQMVKVGYAADGFPIYYKYGMDDSGTIVVHESGYTLRLGERPGDGITAPDGRYNGRYFQDYEYVEGLSDLDACNGRWGKTPESEHEYYYVITDNFPSVPLCFSGTPSTDFRKMGRPPRPGGRPPHPPGREGQRPRRH